MPDPDKQNASEMTRRKPYKTPTLTEYGSVAKLTMAKGSTVLESPSAKKTCL